VVATVAEGPVPKHRQLREILLELITEELVPGSPVPSERELVQRYGVSRATVREAIGQLAQEGRLDRVHGKGTFVASPRVESQLHLASFTEDMRRRGLTPATVVLAAEVAEAPAGAAAALRLGPGEPAYRLERLRLADGLPIALEESWLPVEPLPGLLDHDLAGSVYSLLAGPYGLPLDSGSQTVWAEGADESQARLLRVDPGAPLLVFRRTSSAGARPLEHVTSWYRGDRYQVQMELSPHHPPASPRRTP
jgi:GntR family transcriptional regulator